MLCKYVKQKLDRYVQGDLPDSVSKKIARHISNCQSCADALYRIRKLAGLFKDNPLPPVPRDFRERLMQLASQRQNLHHKSGPEVVRLWEWLDLTSLKKSVAAAGVVIGLSLGLLMGLQSSRQSHQRQAANQIANNSELIDTFRLDYLTEAPENSLSRVYVQMMNSTNKFEE